MRIGNPAIAWKSRGRIIRLRAVWFLSFFCAGESAKRTWSGADDPSTVWPLNFSMMAIADARSDILNTVRSAMHITRFFSLLPRKSNAAANVRDWVSQDSVGNCLVRLEKLLEFL